MNLLHPFPLRRALAAALGSLALLVACGGGVSEQGTGTQPVYASGPISGFGSVIVNGVRYDDTGVTAKDDSGARVDLLLGMVVQIDGENLDRSTTPLPTATAKAITVVSELLGRVDARDDVAGTLTILGQTVSILPTPATDRAVAVGDLVEVYGLYDVANQRYTATRIQHRSGVSALRLHGKVGSVGSNSFTVGGATIRFTTAPDGLAVGAVLRLKLATTPVAANTWTLVSAQTSTAKVPADDTEVEVEGVISSYTSLSSLVVQGITIDASGARLEGGTTLTAGMTIEAEGVMQGGVLRATKVEIKQDEDGGGGGGTEPTEVEITSAIASVNTASKTLVLSKGAQKVDYSTARLKEGLLESQLVAGLRIEVKGVLSSDGSTVLASEIKVDD
ncbi:hypothetical protein KAK06_01820 [Ideonella sp. 4Y11]|uniref:DUF5666 domain-containing protein n=1 Tax=Ideonella aquatica TaxID=2824119 RepID=A0A940YQN6_9BURK|nr:DUF5666 domain-containing protein [Ideonella aquatica]MBQ0957685.1 hypothetical protein [Ideonella aquatica]